MKAKPWMILLISLIIPLIVIFLLFRINVLAGFLGILSWLAILMLFNRVAIYRLKAQIEYKKGNLDNAAKWFEKAVQSRNARTDVKVNYGFILLKSGRLPEAEKILKEAVAESKGNDEKNLARSNLALALWKNGQLDDAISMLTEVIAEYKTTAVYGSLGYLVIEKGDLDEALKINLEAYEYNPDNTIILDNLAHLYHLRGEQDKAGEMFKKLMDKQPHFPEAYYDYARYLEDKGQLEEATEMYQKALSCPFSYTSTITREQAQQGLDNLKNRQD